MNEFGIVILNYNDYELTRDCVNNLLKLGIKNNIVIVDNESKNDSYSFLKRCFCDIKNISIIKSGGNKGYAFGNNCGCRFLLNKIKNLKYLCIMNPDVIIEYKEIFDNLIEKINKHDNIAAITGLMLIRGELKINNCFWSIPKGIEVATRSSIFTELDNNHLEKTDIQYVEAIPGSFFIIKADVYSEINGFDEGTFLYNEEIILAINIQKLGMRNAISTEDYYNHNHIKKSKNLLQTIKQQVISDKSDIYLCKSYYNNKYLFLLYLICVSNHIIIPIRYFYRIIKKYLKGLTC